MNKTISIIMLIFLFLSACCFYKVKPVHAITTYLSDTFESFSTGWTVAGSPANPLKSGEQTHGGSYSAVANTTLVASYAYGYKTVTSTPKSDYRISVWIHPSSVVNALTVQLGGTYNTTAGKYEIRFALNCSNGIFYLTNCLVDALDGTWENVGSMSNNTWHQIEAYYIASTAKIRYYIDSVIQGSNWTPVNVGVYPERYYFGDTSASYWRGKFWCDDLTIDDTAEPAPDTQAPQYSNIGNSTMFATLSCIFSCLWTDNVAVSGYIFGTNNTGTWTNETWTALSGASAWANVTKTLNTTSGYLIQFGWWANDSSNLWNNTGIQSFTTLGWVVTLYKTYFGSYAGLFGHISYNGSIVANGTSLVFYNSTTTLRVEAYPGDGALGNVFELWYKNGTEIDDDVTSYYNPVNVLIDANYIIIANWSQQIMNIPKFTINITNIQVNQSISVDATSTWTKVGVLLPYRWDWGDGSAINYSYTPFSDHKYTAIGVYNITLEVYDVNWLSQSTTFYSITVAEDTSWYIAPGFILGLVCFLGVGFVFVKKRHS
jgi:hypothetical protein